MSTFLKIKSLKLTEESFCKALVSVIKSLGRISVTKMCLMEISEISQNNFQMNGI